MSGLTPEPVVDDAVAVRSPNVRVIELWRKLCRIDSWEEAVAKTAVCE